MIPTFLPDVTGGWFAVSPQVLEAARLKAERNARDGHPTWVHTHAYGAPCESGCRWVA